MITAKVLKFGTVCVGRQSSLNLFIHEGYLMLCLFQCKIISNIKNFTVKYFAEKIFK